jgi:dTDP-glucose pyrophosphorylase
MLRKAFILGAGLGLRLRPLTLNQPKPTLPVLGRPLMEYVFEHLKSVGVNEVVINTHHYPEVYTQLFGSHFSDLIIHYSYEEKLLDTGGGLKKVESFLKDGTFLVYNGDILTDGDLNEALRFHRERNCLATLILNPSDRNPNVALDEESWIQDLRGSLGIQTSKVYTFCGIQILEPEIFQYIPDQAPISIVDVYLNLLRQGKKIGGFVWDRCYWKDIGDLTSYGEVHRELFETKLKGPFPVHRLGQDGSDRAYYRIVPSLISNKNLRPSSVIVMQYGKEKEENNFYHRISLFLRDLGLSVPEILHADPESGILVVQDLGDLTLCHAFEIKPKDEIVAIYKKVMDEILILHQKGAELYEKAHFSISPPFTEKTYRWESNYFEENFLKGIVNILQRFWQKKKGC